MKALIFRIFRSLISMPAWVVVWICFFLIPVNLSGFAFLSFESGIWVAVLGAGALGINTVFLFLNGGFSKVLAIPHLVLWGPLQAILLYRFLTEHEMSSGEETYILIVLAVNGISLVFDVYDTVEWKRGNRGVAGFPGEPVRI